MSNCKVYTIGQWKADAPNDVKNRMLWLYDGIGWITNNSNRAINYGANLVPDYETRFTQAKLTFIME